MYDIPTLYVVVPCYNEEEVINESISILVSKLEEMISDKQIKGNSKILFVNDGSKDNTRRLIMEKCLKDNRLAIINFSRNFGHQSAILAGMLVAREYADAVITIDADLQQDINAMPEFIEKYRNGCDVVYGVRNDRNTDSFFKKSTASAFYGFMRFLGCDVKSNSADYRLLSKKALNALSEYNESNLFLRGLIPLMGFNSDVVYFDVKDRTAGSSKYTFKKMFTLATDGITSLSIKPIRFITVIGFIMCLFSIAMIIFSLIVYFTEGAVEGYSTTVISIWLVGGVVMLSQGIVGEYIGKMYFETKKRPRYIIESMVLNSRNGD